MAVPDTFSIVQTAEPAFTHEYNRKDSGAGIFVGPDHLPVSRETQTIGISVTDPKPTVDFAGNLRAKIKHVRTAFVTTSGREPKIIIEVNTTIPVGTDISRFTKAKETVALMLLGDDFDNVFLRGES